jgi:serine/threonine protein phosphatase PrpC
MKRPAKEVSVSVFARTDAGMQRAENEDAFMVADLTTGNVGLGAKMSTHRVGERGSLMVVSDGMGGAAGGEIASSMAVKTMREALMEPSSEDDCGRLKLATERANQRIWEYAKENRKLTGMGATLTGVLVRNTVEVAMVSVELYKDDILLACTDGLSNKILSEEMGKVMSESENLNAACRRLVELANERGGEDNITVIAARFDGEALHSAAQSNSITGSFKVLSQGCFDNDLSEMGRQFASSVESKQAEDVTTVVLATPRPIEPPPVGYKKPTTLDQSEKQPRSTANRNIIIFVAILALLFVLAAGYFLLRKIN